MPIYEYGCDKCGVFEVSQRITDKPLSRCPTCKSKVRKLISNTSFQLKGSGWYVTDYAGKSSSKDEGKSESKSEGKSESADSKEGSDTKKESKEASAKESSPKTGKTGKADGKKTEATAA